MSGDRGDTGECGKDADGSGLQLQHMVTGLVRDLADPESSTRVSLQGRPPPAQWAEAPFDILREVAGKLSAHDMATALLVCREWRDGFANGMTSLRPRMLRIVVLAAR